MRDPLLREPMARESDTSDTLAIKMQTTNSVISLVKHDTSKVIENQGDYVYDKNHTI